MLRNSVRFLVSVLAVWMMSLSSVSAQDAVPSLQSVPKFAGSNITGFTVQGGQTVFKVFDTIMEQHLTFRIPTESLKRFFYNDSIHVNGRLESLILERPEDFDYVARLCLDGRRDARIHYKMWKPSATGTLVLSVISPVLGLACALPASLTKPRIENLGLPDVDMLHEDIYFQAYQKEAWRKKNVANWISFGIGFGIHAGAIFAIMSFVQPNVAMPTLGK